MSTSYHLRFADSAATPAVQLDAAQQQVVEHESGPLLVLAGPGTGKTTTMVEAMVERIEARDVAPESVLALTFSRKAAEQLRDRVTARLGRTVGSTLSTTFHSFAYGLVREFSPSDAYAEPLRLLSSPEADVVLQELLADNEEAVTWPDTMKHAIGTRGFARELHDVLARVREKGLEGPELRALGESEGMPEYVAAGWFLDEYLDNLDYQGALDYADLIRRAKVIAEEHRDRLRARYQWVFVDEYQDTDPGQVQLLQALAGDGRNLVVVGDPHQSIYGFRGADIRGILNFPKEFPTVRGEPSPVLALTSTRRFGPRLLEAAQRVSGRLSLPGSLPAEAREAFASPQCLADAAPGEVEVLTFDTDRAESEHLADILRRAHLEDDIAWGEMAVLARSGRATLPAIRRSLVAAGVPVEVAADDTPLVREPAVVVLLDALRAAVNLDNDDPTSSGYLDPGRVEALLKSPLGGLDAADLRSVARVLRLQEKERAATEGGTPLSSAEALRAALIDPSVLDDLDSDAADAVHNVSALLHAAREASDNGASAEEVLWQVWTGTSWPHRLRDAVDTGGGVARMAHRDADAVMALFDYAAKVESRRDRTSVSVFLDLLDAQAFPSDTLAEQGVRGDAVRLLTAHRAKGLEWELVVVAHVQEESWPNLRRRSSLLKADQITPQGVVPPPSLSSMLAEERRLFYVACTRARTRLIVSAVDSAEDDGERASRFLGEVAESSEDRPVIDHRIGRPVRPLSLPGVIADLRRTVTADDTSPALRAAAARRLRSLGGEYLGARPLAPSAQPGRWWGVDTETHSQQPLRDPDKPVSLSASTVDAMLVCPAKWFLEREAGGVSAASQASGFGQIVHAIAAAVHDDVDLHEASVEDLMPHVDEVWDQLAFRTPWAREKLYADVRGVLQRFLNYHRRPGARTVVDTERRFDVTTTLPDGRQVRLNGFMDRLELDEDGHCVVVDLKAGKYAPSKADVEVHPQLGFYQSAVESGAVAGCDNGGAELVQLVATTKESEARIQRQDVQQVDDEGWTISQRQIGHAVDVLANEEFVAMPGDHCRWCAFASMCPAKNPGSVLS